MAGGAGTPGLEYPKQLLWGPRTCSRTPSTSARPPSPSDRHHPQSSILSTEGGWGKTSKLWDGRGTAASDRSSEVGGGGAAQERQAAIFNLNGPSKRCRTRALALLM